jgi:hypothetical protein
MAKTWVAALACAALGALALPAADDKKPDKKAARAGLKLPPAKGPAETFTDPAQAGPDYAVQGEYEGSTPGGEKIGAQVVACGDGVFAVRLLRGGLPGAGWDGKTESDTVAVREGDKAVITDGGGEIVGSRLTATRPGATAALSKVERKSPTLGEKPPAGAVVLFDGQGADQWDKGKLTPDGLLSVARTGSIRSKPKFRDFTAHVEFRLPFMPRSRGQARANSGVYLQDRYELQVLDSFGLEGLNNECGGFYQQSDPKVNMCLPPLVWQTYDIDFTAAKFEGGKKVKNAVATVRHNGVVVQDHFELPGPSPGGKKEDETPGPLQLQDHGNPLVYRNIWVVERK